MGFGKCIIICIYQYSITWNNYSTVLKIFSVPSFHLSIHSLTLWLPMMFQNVIELESYSMFHLSNINLRFFYDYQNYHSYPNYPNYHSYHNLICHFILSLNSIPLYGKPTILFIHTSYWSLGDFLVGAVINEAAIKIPFFLVVSDIHFIASLRVAPDLWPLRYVLFCVKVDCVKERVWLKLALYATVNLISQWLAAWGLYISHICLLIEKNNQNFFFFWWGLYLKHSGKQFDVSKSTVTRNGYKLLEMTRLRRKK
jgi:hypothetical protein